jgi:uncharacterized damage-inducible protein DinB
VTEFPEPAADTADPAVLFARYLDYYRDTVLDKVSALDAADLRRSRLPTGWTPLELLSHLAHMEQRWFVWGFLGEDVDDPWGEQRDDRWHVPEEVGLEELGDFLRRTGERTTSLLAESSLDAVGKVGGRFDDEPPNLAWICFHVLQEYARHAGHLDVAVELAGGPTGE